MVSAKREAHERSDFNMLQTSLGTRPSLADRLSCQGFGYQVGMFDGEGVAKKMIGEVFMHGCYMPALCQLHKWK